MSAVTLATIKAAQKTIRGIATTTPLLPSPFLTARCGQEILLKLESLQPIGAFKLRGAANALANLPKGATGVACCSTGNHGRGVAFAAKKLGLRAVVLMTDKAPQTKIDAIRALGAEARVVNGTQDDAQAEVDRLFAGEGLIDISPFDDPYVIAGQGTIALELLHARPDLENIVLPLSGGGLAAGVALAAKALKPMIRVIGVTMENGPAMVKSMQAGHPVEVGEYGSLADSLGGGIFANNRYTLSLCTRLLDDTLLVSEAEIYHAMQALYYQDRLISEGGAAVGPAALLAARIADLDGPTAVVITGRNVDMAMFTRLVNGAPLDIKGTKIPGRIYPAP